MPAQELDVELYRELICRGLPEDYAQRVAGELHDHHRDLVAELEADNTVDNAAENAAARLGNPASLAKQIASDYRRRSWFGRWPLINFVLLPIPLLFMGWIAIYAVIAAITVLCDKMGVERLNVFAQEVAFNTAFFVLLIAAPSVIAFLWGRLALKTVGSRFLVLVPCVLLAITAAVIWHESHGSDIPGKSYFRLGSAAFTPTRSWPSAHPFGTHQWCQLLGPLAAGAMLIVGDIRRRGRALRLDSPPPINRIAA